MWGLLAFSETPQSPALLYGGLIVSVLGVSMISSCETISGCAMQLMYDQDQVEKSTLRSSSTQKLDILEPILITDGESSNSISKALVSGRITFSGSRKSDAFFRNKEVVVIRQNQLVLGVFYSVLCGFAQGSILVPLYFVSDEDGGLVFVPSFGVGSFLAAVLILIGRYFKNNNFPPFHYREGLLMGIICGLLTNTTNVLVIIALPIIGYTVANPLIQLSLLVSGTWGILLFDEISGLSIFVFYGAGFVLLTGATIISLGYGTG